MIARNHNKNKSRIHLITDPVIILHSAAEYLFPKGEPATWVFMQDGAGCHQGKKVQKWLAKNLGDNVATPSVNWRDVDNLSRWPSNSPDCNPIENLWAFFQNAVAEKQPKTVEQFKTLLTKVWWDKVLVPQDHIRNLYHCIPERLVEVVAGGGAMTRY